MPHRIRRTHRLTATRTTGSYDYGTDPGATESTPVSDEPVRYIPEGTSYVRGETGERVQRSPRVRGRPALMDLQEGDRLTLTPVSAGGETVEDVEVRSIDPQYGGQTRADAVIVELEDV